MFQHILVPVDGSTASLNALDEAIRLASESHASLCLLHVLEASLYGTGYEAYALYSPNLVTHLLAGGESILKEAKHRAERAGCSVQTRLIDGIALSLTSVVLAEVARQPVDLVVIGTHGRQGVGRLVFGSEAEQIARVSPVPVLLVPLLAVPAQRAARAPAQRVPHAA